MISHLTSEIFSYELTYKLTYKLSIFTILISAYETLGTTTTHDGIMRTERPIRTLNELTDRDTTNIREYDLNKNNGVYIELARHELCRFLISWRQKQEGSLHFHSNSTRRKKEWKEQSPFCFLWVLTTVTSKSQNFSYKSHTERVRSAIFRMDMEEHQTNKQTGLRSAIDGDFRWFKGV